MNESKKLKVGIQGGKGSFNEEALRHLQSKRDLGEVQIDYLYTTENVLNALEAGQIDRGLFAMHNSVGGVVTESVYALAKHKVRIVEEFFIVVRHHLMRLKGIDPSEIKRIMAHPQALKQCQGTLEDRFSELELRSGEGDLIDTANAAKALVEGKIDSNVYLLGPEVLADIYEFEIDHKNLQDSDNNLTSFLFVERFK